MQKRSKKIKINNYMNCIISGGFCDIAEYGNFQKRLK